MVTSISGLIWVEMRTGDAEFEIGKDARGALKYCSNLRLDDCLMVG